MERRSQDAPVAGMLTKQKRPHFSPCGAWQRRRLRLPTFWRTPPCPRQQVCVKARRRSAERSSHFGRGEGSGSAQVSPHLPGANRSHHPAAVRSFSPVIMQSLRSWPEARATIRKNWQRSQLSPCAGRAGVAEWGQARLTTLPPFLPAPTAAKPRGLFFWIMA